MLLILPLGWTFKVSSEYRSMASVFSSWGGRGAFTRARIHCGASAARSEGEVPAEQTTPRRNAQASRSTGRLVRGVRSRLQYDLLVIGGPYGFIELSKRRVKLSVQTDQAVLHEALQVERSAAVLDLLHENQCFGVIIRAFWKAADLPARRQFDRDVVHLLR